MLDEVAPVVPDVLELLDVSAVPPVGGTVEDEPLEEPMPDDEPDTELPAADESPVASADELPAAPVTPAVPELLDVPVVSSDEEPEDGDTSPAAVPVADPIPDAEPDAEPEALGPVVPQAAKTNAQAIGKSRFFMIPP